MGPSHLHTVRSQMFCEYAQCTGQGRMSQDYFAVPGLFARPQIAQGRRLNVQCLGLCGHGRNDRAQDEQGKNKTHSLLDRVHHVEDRQVHRDHHAADDHAEDDDHHRLHQ